MTLRTGTGLPLLTLNYVKCFKCLFIPLSLPHNCETLLEHSVDKKGWRIEDTLLEIMEKNIFWRSSRTVFFEGNSLCQWLALPIYLVNCAAMIVWGPVLVQSSTEQWWWWWMWIHCHQFLKFSKYMRCVHCMCAQLNHFLGSILLLWLYSPLDGAFIPQIKAQSMTEPLFLSHGRL